MDKKILDKMESIALSMTNVTNNTGVIASKMLDALKANDKDAYIKTVAIFRAAVLTFNALGNYESFKIDTFSKMIDAEAIKRGWVEQPQQAQPEAKTEAKPASEGKN
jgi:lysozyme family protein